MRCAVWGVCGGLAARVALVLTTLHWGALALTLVQPRHDDEVLDVLPSITRSRPALALTPRVEAPNPMAAAIAARQDIRIARQSGDTRFWGRAQAVLAPWWNRPDAPAELAILQATVQQGRHEFDAARHVLSAALARAPGQAQGWLNLAALERLSARYAPAMRACKQVARAGQTWYARACSLETLALQAHTNEAVQGLKKLLLDTRDDAQKSWLISLLAEAWERTGHDLQAASAYQRSLALSPDLYTAIAYTDLLLRTGQPRQALEVLSELPATDAVLLRRATAWRSLGDARWVSTREMLRQRVAELQLRGDDVSLHGRELALIALWLDDDAAQAVTLARRNLLLQREPLDWYVALQSAAQAGDQRAQREVQRELLAVGLEDIRLTTARRGPQGRLRAAPPPHFTHKMQVSR